MDQKNASVRHVDALVIGAGFAGVYMLHLLRSRGFATQVVEAAAEIGGTWYWNRYPGCRCDVESLQYCYTFSDEIDAGWRWSERYPSAPEILRYIQYVADKLDLRRNIQLNTRVTAAHFMPDGLWHFTTDTGDRFTARYFVSALGCLSAPRRPDFPGLESFKGEIYHTGLWPREDVHFAGKRVGVIGTGSSGVQLIPEIAKEAAQVVVFQRTPAFCLPARNRPLDAAEVDEWFTHKSARRQFSKNVSPRGMLFDAALGKAADFSKEERDAEYWRRWEKGSGNFLYAFSDILTDQAANQTAADFIRDRIREQVRDPVVAQKLTPTSYAVGTKRPCIDTDYYITFNRPNVELVAVRENPIAGFTDNAVKLADGSTYPLDVMVFATGFDAVSGPLLGIDVRGHDGMSLRDKWAHGPRTYLGLMVAEFPNMFIITGPGSPSVLGNVLISIEQHAEFIANCLAWMRIRGLDTIEARRSAEDAWVAEVAGLVAHTLLTDTDSWYMGANIPGKPRVFLAYLGGMEKYRHMCDAIAATGYSEFTLGRSAAAQVA